MVAKFETNQNPIAPGDLQQTYLSAAGHLAAAASYGQLIQQQPGLDVSLVDAGLGVLIGAFQKRMRDNAAFFASSIVPNMITLMADGSNLCAEVAAVVVQPASGSSAAVLFRALSDTTDSTHVDARTLVSHVLVSQQANQDIQASYTTALDTAIAALGADAQAISSVIAALNTAAQQNIDDIVAGSVALGEAVTTLIIGVLTTVKPASADGEEGDGSTEFVANAITVGSGGVGQSSQAMADLQSNNTKLAVAYQQLATDNALLAIAKIVEAQNLLFVGSLSSLSADVKSLEQGWLTAKAAFDAFASELASASPATAPALIREVTSAQLSWAALNTELDLVKKALVSRGGLPSA
ncbi:MAG: hypothetical protein ABJE95_07760 [Byssovorax sp.]